jgi:hypothetical protein
MRSVAGCGASGDDASRFLRELRQLRDGAGLGQAELAARAHYPSDYIRAAEAGPSLPDLPVLSAYVRGCGGTTEEWEERWRSLTRTPSLPVLSARAAGRSAAASAGARIGAVSPVAETPDPSVIMAALDRVAEGMAGSGAGTLPSSPVPVQPVPVQPLPVAPVPVQPVPVQPVAADSLAGVFASAAPEPMAAAEPSAPEAVPGADARPSGWDPIRVSSAWPALRPTPTEDDSAASAVVPAQGAVPSTGVPSTGAAGRVAAPWDRAATPPQATVKPVRTAAPVASDGRSASSRVRMVAIAAVLLCVLAVLLAIFA